MNKLGFLFLSSFLMIISMFTGIQTIDPSIQLLVSLTIIVLLGIPHGAIDHIIFLEDNEEAKPKHFYRFYFGLMAIYLIGWITIPMISLILFLILSAYHFGQAQFSELTISPSWASYILYFSWGCALLSGLILYNLGEIQALTSLSQDMAYLSSIFDEAVFIWFLPLSALSTIILLVTIFQKNQISSERFFFELYLFILLQICFYILPLIIGFTLYFVILHSFKVLSEEFSYLQSRRRSFSIPVFIKLLLPFTLISIVGSGIILLCAKYQLIGVSNVKLVFCLISLLTLPHSVVMDQFYQKLMT